MARLYPALEIRHGGPADFVLAAVDDFGPTAVEEHDGSIRVFFATDAGRDAALADLTGGPLSGTLDVMSLDVSDEDWARRSQDTLQPITIGRFRVTPHVDGAGLDGLRDRDDEHTIELVIPASMGFGTGHHATTRMCLEALQALPLEGRFVLDVGTGSGVLALAAGKLGAARAIGFDNDPDAVMAAVDNLPLNGDVSTVSFEVADLAGRPLPEADVVTANLTGALLVRSAALLVSAVRPGGHLILSGILDVELADVLAAFSGLAVTHTARDGEWVGLTLMKSL